ncbi:MAG: hypothetical protein ABIO49_15985 [Dokdonella sp.]
MFIRARKYSVFTAVATAVCLSGSVLAARPPQTEAEAGDVAAQRELYFALRRANPYDVNFDSAAARLRAYRQFQAAVAAHGAAPSSSGHNESWQSIGPAPITLGQTPTSATDASRSPVSGRVSSLAIDPIDNAVYAGGAQGGVWRTLDNGTTWSPLTDYLGSLAVGVITVAPGAHPLNQGTLFLGTGEGNFSADSYAGIGIYKSTDSGHTWQGPYGQAQFINRSVTTIAVDSANPQHILAGSSSGVFGVGGVAGAPAPVRGIYISNDGGLTWAISASAPAQARISRIVQDPITAATWWAGVSLIPGNTGGGLLKSLDNGATWSSVDGVASGLPAIVGNNGVGGIARTWLSISSSGGSSVIYLGVGLITDGGTGYGGKLYVSTDGGSTWANKPAANGFCQGQCWYDMPIYTPPESPTTVFTGGGGDSGAVPSSFMRSTDSGSTLADKMVGVDGNSALHADFHAITSWPGQPTHLWIGNDGGVFRSDDNGDHWISANTNLQLTQFEQCDLHPTDPAQAYGGTQDNGTNSFLGQTAWTHSDDGDGGFALIDQGAPNQVTHTYFNQSNYLVGAAVALNGPASGPSDYQYFAGTYSGQNNGINPADRVLFYAPMTLDRGLHDTLYFGTDHLYVAPDFFNKTVNATASSIVYTAVNGGNAFAPPVPPSATPGAISAIQSVANVLPGQPANTLFVGTSNGRVWLSTNGGTSFTETDNAPVIAQYVSGIAINPRNANNVFAARAGFTGATPAHNVRVSNNAGATWVDASTGLPDIPVNAIAFDPIFPNQVWAGTDIGMYLSTNGGATWIPYNQGIPNVAIFDIKANRDTHTVLACTHGRGAFRLNVDAIFIDGFENQ